MSDHGANDEKSRTNGVVCERWLRGECRFLHSYPERTDSQQYGNYPTTQSNYGGYGGYNGYDSQSKSYSGYGSGYDYSQPSQGYVQSGYSPVQPSYGQPSPANYTQPQNNYSQPPSGYPQYQNTYSQSSPANYSGSYPDGYPQGGYGQPGGQALNYPQYAANGGYAYDVRSWRRCEH